MLYKELVDYLLTEVSSTEFDLLVYSAIRVDWNGYLQSTPKEIADAIGSTEKYVKHMLKKLSFRFSFRRPAFAKEYDQYGEFTYKLLLGVPGVLKFDENTADYCKNYSFFHTAEFRALSIHSKRVILAGAYHMSIYKNEEVELGFNFFVPTKKSVGISKFTRGRLFGALSEINTALANTVEVSTTKFTGRFETEIINFKFAPNTLSNFKEREGAFIALRNKFVEHGFYKELSDGFCTELLKTTKYIYNSIQKFGAVVSTNSTTKLKFDDLIEIADSVYNRSITAFIEMLYKKIHFLNNPKEASAYFSSIIQDTMTEELSFYLSQTHIIEDVISVLDKPKADFKPKYQYPETELNETRSCLENKVTYLTTIANLLEMWNVDWIQSRVNSVVEIFSEAPKTVANKDLIIAAQEKLLELKYSLKKKLENLSSAMQTLQNNNIVERLTNVYVPKVDVAILRLENYIEDAPF